MFFNTKVAPSDSLYKSEAETIKLSKSLRYLFIFLQFFFAIDNGFVRTKSAKITILLKLWAFLHFSLIFVYITIWTVPFPEVHSVWLYLVNVQYFLFAAILLSRKYSFFDFQTDLHLFDRKINVVSSYRPELRLYALFILLILYMSSKGYFFNKTFSVTKFFTSYDGYYHVVSVFGLESIRITYALVFASTCWRIEKFISFVSKDDVNVVECHYLYKYITDVTEKAKGNYDVVFIITLLWNSISITIMLFLGFLTEDVTKKDLGQYFLMDLITMTKNFIIMLAPIFKAGLLTFKVQKLLLILRDKLLLAKDDSQKVDIKRFINYIEVRPMKFAVWRVVPLDWTLPIVLINLSVTYLIVMIQFTHKY